LSAVDLKQRVIWRAECRPSGDLGLAFGGQDQDADDGRPHTRLLIDGEWKAIHEELRARSSLRSHYERAWALRAEAKRTLAAARAIYFKGLGEADEARRLGRDVIPRLSRLAREFLALETVLPTVSGDEYERGQALVAARHLKIGREQLPAFREGTDASELQSFHRAQIQVELAAEALDAEPPPRAMNCGVARLPGGATGPPGETLVHDERTKLFVLFGGDHLDYLTNDTWVFDPARRRWMQRHPDSAPRPRANHRLEAVGDGTIRMTGGYTYSSNTDYVGGQYVDIDDGPWIYDLRKNQWRTTRGEAVPADSRVYRTGPFHPDFYLAGPKPDETKFEAWLAALPVNEWVRTDPPHRPRLNRDWGTARIDPSRDMILRWSGGHSAHGGTDVPHFHFSTNRWELPFPVEFPLGQLYSNTSYPNGLNFNRRPWMTGHTYQNYAYDPPSRMMIKAGRPRHYYVYDPDEGDWVGRGRKPVAMQYGSCFYTLTLAATPDGAVCWDKNGRVHRFDHVRGGWVELEVTGDKLPGAYVDNSSIAYDSKRHRVLIVNTQGYGKPYDGRVWSLDLKTSVATELLPEGRQHASRLATVDKSCYHPGSDLLLMGTYLRNAGDHTPTPAYDCARNRWVTLDIGYPAGKRSGRTTREFPHRRSDALMFDARRDLIWGTDTDSQVYVLRLNVDRSSLQPLR